MTPQHHLPADIERTSLKMIAAELAELGLTPPPETEAVVRRVIHTTADFDYAKNLRFTPGAVQKAVEALHKGAFLVTDTNMALAGITKPGLAKLGGQAACYMADPEVAARAKAEGTTRAVAAMHKAAAEHPGAILAVGNAPTALLTIAEQIEAGLRPALVIGERLSVFPRAVIAALWLLGLLFCLRNAGKQHGHRLKAAHIRNGTTVVVLVCPLFGHHLSYRWHATK